jgi:hypothetical protein
LKRANQTAENLEHRRIDRALAGLEDAVRRCREEDVRYRTGVLRLSLFWNSVLMKKWPFERFRKALEDPGMDGTKPEARWQILNASLNAIKRAVRPGGLPVKSSDRRG